MNSNTGFGDVALPVLILFGGLLLAYYGMWHGWKKREKRHDLPPLVPTPAVADLPEADLRSGARYFGTTVSGAWLDRVVARGLGARSTCRLALSRHGLDVIRMPGSFRIPAAALRGARRDRGIAGKVVPPHGVLVVTWQHGDFLLDTGFRLTEPDARGRPRRPADRHETWIRSINKIVEEHTA